MKSDSKITTNDVNKIPGAYQMNGPRKTLSEYGMTFLGTLVFVAAINLFIVPVNLYNGGLIGIAQIIRTLLIEKANINFGGVDIAGIINFIFNVPLFILAYMKLGKPFFRKTVFGVVLQTVFFTLIKCPAIPIIEDTLTSCLVGGILAGFGNGIVLRAGGSGGGLDILGMYATKIKPGFSVGKLSMFFNFGVYFICALLFNVEVVIYSVIYMVFTAIIMDKVHYQNINTSVMIFSKKDGLSRAIIDELGRGVTEWSGSGAYTHENTQVLVTVISKYEISRLKGIIYDIDPNAFMILNEGLDVYGNFEKRL